MIFVIVVYRMPELPDLSDFSPLRKPKEDADKQYVCVCANNSLFVCILAKLLPIDNHYDRVVRCSRIPQKYFGHTQ